MNLREAIHTAEKKGVAIPHFNVSTLEMFHGVVDVAKKHNLPMIIGVSEGERDFMGMRDIVELVRVYRAEGLPLYLNADHTYSVERVKEAIDLGFDAAIFDGAKLSLEENTLKTKECVRYARAQKGGLFSKGRDVIIEGELGYIGQSSKVLDAIPEGVSLENLTTPEEAELFVRATGIDLLAPAVGNIHGMLRASKDPRLNISRIHDIRMSARVPLVLHGGSGTEDADFVSAIKMGMSIVHVSTEIRVAYRQALEKSFAEKKEEVAPYKYLISARDAVRDVAEARTKLFMGL